MDLLILAFTLLIFLKDLVWCKPGPQNYQMMNPSLQRRNEILAAEEQEMILTLANTKLQPRDAHAQIAGAIDDLQIVQELGQNSDEDDLAGEAHLPLHGIDLTSFIIQRVSKKTNTTNYFAFEDNPDSKPLFTRTIEDHGVDFIIFMDPALPKGTGHYIILRRLESHIDLVNYAADEEVEIHEELQDRMYDFEDEDNEAEDDDRLGGGYEDYYSDPRRMYPKSETFGLSYTEQLHYEVPGAEQSGEENEPNTALIPEEELDKEKEWVSPNNETLIDEKTAAEGEGPLTWKEKFAQPPQHEEDGDVKEIIYESFLVIFKGSVHGFISSIDPLQFSFQAEGDPAGVLTESQEDDDGTDKVNVEGEDDDDDGSYDGLNDPAEELFVDFPDKSKGGKRKKRSVDEWLDRPKKVRLGECVRRVGKSNVESWRKLDLGFQNE